MKYIAVFLINLYQQYISPYKGFCCAYASLYGGNSCSQAIKLILIEEGCLRGYSMSQSRFRDCRNANEELNRRRQNQACECLGDGGCELAEGCPSISSKTLFDNACDIPSCDCSF